MRVQKQSGTGLRLASGIIAGIAFTLLILVVAGIINNPVTAKLSPRVSVSPDDQYITFAYDRAVHISNIGGTGARRLTFPENEYHARPEYTPDGQKIVFISYPQTSSKRSSCINVVDINGDNLRQVTCDHGLITHAIASQDGQKVYYINSAYYGSYSPFYHKLPHEPDIYSVNIDGAGRKRLTDLTAYTIDNLSLSPDGKLLYFYQEGVSDKDFQGPQDFCRVLYLDDAAQGESKGAKAGRYCLLSSDERYTAEAQLNNISRHKRHYEYELYLLDVKTRQKRQLTDLKGCVLHPRFFHHQSRIIFANHSNWPDKRNPRYELMTVNLDGSGLARINFDLKALSVMSP